MMLTFENAVQDNEKVMDFLIKTDKALWYFISDNPDVEQRLCEYVRTDRRFATDFADYITEQVKQANERE